MSKHRESKVRKTSHVIGFVWTTKSVTYNKPISRGKSVCTHCGIPKIRESRTQGSTSKGSRTRRDGCKVSGREHVYATEQVMKGWSNEN